MNQDLPPYTKHFDPDSGITFIFKRDQYNTRILHIANHLNAYNEPRVFKTWLTFL
jgi:hypothetical protein